jgi:hypothetical protein
MVKPNRLRGKNTEGKRDKFLEHTSANTSIKVALWQLQLLESEVRILVQEHFHDRHKVMYTDSWQTVKIPASLGSINAVKCKHKNNFANALCMSCHTYGRKNTEPDGLEVTLSISIHYMFVRISAGTSAMETKSFSGLPRSLQTNSGTVPPDL